MQYKNFKQVNDVFIPNKRDIEPAPELPAGYYNVAIDNQGEVFFQKFVPNYDGIIDLPSPEFEEIIREFDSFLSTKAIQDFKDYDFLYKRSALLHGLPGTGKSILVTRICEKVIEKNGVILFGPDPRFLRMAYKVLDEIQPSRLTMVVFEEFEETVDKFQNLLLTLLDAQIQKNNIIYLATTNHYDRIPVKFRRPSRFSTILEVGYPNSQARTSFLENKLKAKDYHEIPTWVNKTAGFSIDELKETVLAVKCLNKTLDESVARVKATKENKSSQAGIIQSAEDEVMNAYKVLERAGHISLDHAFTPSNVSYMEEAKQSDEG